jgi:hypothetical protein
VSPESTSIILAGQCLEDVVNSRTGVRGEYSLNGCVVRSGERADQEGQLELLADALSIFDLITLNGVPSMDDGFESLPILERVLLFYIENE